MKMVMGMMSAVIALGAMADDPVISDVVARQRWPWSRLVDIDYVMAGTSTQQVDIVISAKDGVESLTLPLNSLTGDLYNVARGMKRIVWDPTKTTYTNNLALTHFTVTLEPIRPLYMIIDLTKSAGMADQIEYVTEAALTNNQFGAWVRNPVTNRGEVIESVIWTGVTNDTAYMTDKLVLRRIPAGSCRMGDNQTGDNNVTLTRDMYVGVFEVTQQQWNHIMNSTGGANTQAKHTVSYYDIRENPENKSDPDVNWPSNAVVNASSFVGRLRTQTGIFDFDLPTEAQWEYFCRAGTTTVFNDGITNALYTGTEADNNGNTNKYLNVLGWYKFNVSTPPTAAQTVGGKQPNAWGLYDTHGNVWEWCLDWYASSLNVGEDPKGPDSGLYHMRRGGSWHGISASLCRSAYRNPIAPSFRDNDVGFRIVRTLP